VGTDHHGREGQRQGKEKGGSKSKKQDLSSGWGEGGRIEEGGGIDNLVWTKEKG